MEKRKTNADQYADQNEIEKKKRIRIENEEMLIERRITMRKKIRTKLKDHN